jgi:hypothetical protein
MPIQEFYNNILVFLAKDNKGYNLSCHTVCIETRINHSDTKL